MSVFMHLREICTNATPGPWYWQYTRSGGYLLIGYRGGTSSPQIVLNGSWGQSAADCTVAAERTDRLFITASRIAMPLLLDVAECAAMLSYNDAQPQDMDRLALALKTLVDSMSLVRETRNVE